MGDKTPFDSTLFDDHVPTPGAGGGSSSAEEMAREQALSEPDRDPNEIRELYDLDPLDEEELAEWLAS